MGDQGEKRKTEASSDKAAKKAKFFSTNKGVTLPLGTRGFLVSCLPNKSKLAGQEAIRVLQPYYEENLPAAKASDGKNEDISSILASEVADLKDPKKQLFKQHETGISSLVFISMAKEAPGPGPAELMQIVARDIQKSRQCRVRLCMRFTPVEAICAVNLDDIKKVAAEVVWPRFKLESGKRFAVAYEHRASTGMDRLAVIKAVADGIKQAKLLGPARTATLLHIRFAEDHGSQKRMPPNKADLKTPEVTILVQVVKDFCAIGVVSQYRELAKYNLRELCSPSEPENSKPAKPEDVGKQIDSAANGEKPSPGREAKPEEQPTTASVEKQEQTEGANGSTVQT